jgi:stage II sporulation protein D
MKQITLRLVLILLLSCLLPAAGYYLAIGVRGGDAAAAVRQFWADAAQSAPALRAPQRTASPAESAAPSGETGGGSAATAAAETVLVQNSGTGEVLTVPLRDYLIGAVAAEMPVTWPDAALQAQAVAAHSYALYCRDHNDTAAMGGAWLTADPARRQGYLTDEVLHSYWGTGYTAKYARLSALIDAVSDTVVTYGGAPADACYFAISNGRTEASQNVWDTALPYLQGVDSSADRSADGYETTESYTVQQMYDALASGLGLKADGIAPDTYFGSAVLTDAGYVYTIEVCGTRVRGTVLRSALHLRSACFTIGYADQTFTVVTRGYGHGVGLSQAGAKAMAEAGSSWQDILQHYFPGTALGHSAAAG